MMEAKVLNRYHFDKVVNQAKKDFDQLKAGEEETYLGQLFALEKVVLELHEQEQLSLNQIKDVFKIVLFDVYNRLQEEQADYSKVMEEELIAAAQKIEKQFMPFDNQHLTNRLKISYAFSDRQFLQQFLTLPVQCILRVLYSMEHWTKQGGKNGYFNRSEPYIKGNKTVFPNPFMLSDEYIKMA